MRSPKLSLHTPTLRAVQRVVLATAILACGEMPTAPDQQVPQSPPSAPTEIVARIACRAEVRAKQVACAVGDGAASTATGFKGWSPNGVSPDLILGGQNTFVRLTSSNVTWAAAVFSFDVTVLNLIGQKLGTIDGSTVAPSGVRVFFENPPVVLTGTGSIDYTNPVGGGSMVDGVATFTSTNQAYYQYDQVLAWGQTSAVKNWRLHVPSTVGSFQFFVFVSAPVQFPTGFVEMSPSSVTLAAGQTMTITPTLKDEIGRPAAGQPVRFGTSNTAVATVDANTGLVTAVGDGSATITATSGSRSGSVVVTVSTASGIAIDAGDLQTAIPGAAVAVAPSVIVRNASNVPMPNVSVTFSVTGGGGSATGLTTITNGDGIATVGSWTLGAGGAGCSAAAITNCSRNTLRAVVNGGANPSVNITAYVPPTVPTTATYQAVGNATLSIAPAIGLLQNAFSINGPLANGQGATLTATMPNSVGTNGGNAALSSDGSFAYLSSPNYVSAGNATDDFTYSVSDGRATTAMNATLKVNVPQHVWYVRPGFVGTSTGSDVAPFKDFSSTAGVGVETPGAATSDDVILVQTGTGIATGGTLGPHQILVGQGVSAAHTFMTGSAAAYRNGGTAITLLAPGASPQVGSLLLAPRNALSGITLVGSNATALRGSSFSELAVSEVVIDAGANQALSLNSGTVSGSFTSISSSGGTNNVMLSNVATTGAVSLGIGTLFGASSDAFRVSGETGTFTYAGSIANNTTLAVNVAGRSGGSLTFSGNINSLASPGKGISVSGSAGGTTTFNGAEIGISSGASAGVDMSVNTSSTIVNFAPTNALAIVTTSGVGIRASSGGTITVTGTANTVNSSAASALDIDDVSVGTAGITFSSVTSNGGTTGVSLTNVGGSGSIQLGGGSLSNATGTAFAVSGGTNVVSYAGTVAKITSGQLVTIASRTAGNVTLSGILGCTSSCGAAGGAIAVTGVAGGTISFSGVTKTLSTGANPAVILTSNAGATIDFANGGLAILTSGANAKGFIATGGGTILVGEGPSDNTLSASGTAIDWNGMTIGNTGVTFASTSSRGGANNVNLIALSGASFIELGDAGTLTNATDASFVASGLSVDLSYGGAIAKTSPGQIFVITNLTSSGAHLSGNFSCTGTCGSASGAIVVGNNDGVVEFSGSQKTITGGLAGYVGVALGSNVGGTTNFTNGGLVVNTSGRAFGATNGGTVSVRTGANPNTLQSASGPALNVEDTDIGASGLNFRSISVAGGANGIVLRNTGTAGGLTVTGDGGNSNNGSGGTIANTTGTDGAVAGNGIYLNGTSRVSLSAMNISGHANNGLYGTGVRGLTMNVMRFDGNNGNSTSASFNESAVQLVSLGGAVRLQGSVLDGGAMNALRIVNSSGTAPTLDSLVIVDNDVNAMQGSLASPRGSAMFVSLTDGTADIRIRDNTILTWWVNAIHVLVQGTASATTRITSNYADNTNAAVNGASGIVVVGGTHVYDVFGNTVVHANGPAISAERINSGAVLQGTIEYNTIGLSGVFNSGSFTGIGIAASHRGPGSTIANINYNVLRQINGSPNGAITTTVGNGALNGGSGTMNATIIGNNIQQSGTTVDNGQHGILINHGVAAGDTDTGCYDIGGVGLERNVIQNLTSGTANNRIAVVEKLFGVARFPGYLGATNDNTALGSYLLARNTASTFQVANNVSIGGGGFTNTTPAGSGCLQPIVLP